MSDPSASQPPLRLEDIPAHQQDDPRYRVHATHFRTLHGRLLREEPAVYRRLHAVGDWLMIDGLELRVRRIALADGIEHVNIEPA